MWTPQIGARSEPVRNSVEEGPVRRFAQAIGDLNPLYLDRDRAALSRWGRRIAPPTFPRTFDYGTVPGLRLPASGVVLGEEAFHYQRPVFVGEDLFCHAVLRDVYRRQGRAGMLTLVVVERVGEDAGGERVFTGQGTYILTEAVVRRMEP